MTVSLDRYRLLYVSAPKVACTSVKTAMFELENGVPFREFHANGVQRHIHDPAIYPALPFEQVRQLARPGMLKLALVRDPVRRLLSCYANRVVHFRELSVKVLGSGAFSAELPPDPDLATFLARLDGYRAISRSIWLHSQPLVYFLGQDQSFYDHLFDITRISEFDETIRAHTGRPFRSPHLQTGGPALGREDLSRAQVQAIRSRYDEDWRAFGSLFA